MMIIIIIIRGLLKILSHLKWITVFYNSRLIQRDFTKFRASLQYYMGINIPKRLLVTVLNSKRLPYYLNILYYKFWVRQGIITVRWAHCWEETVLKTWSSRFSLFFSGVYINLYKPVKNNRVFLKSDGGFWIVPAEIAVNVLIGCLYIGMRDYIYSPREYIYNPAKSTE